MKTLFTYTFILMCSLVYAQHDVEIRITSPNDSAKFLPSDRLDFTYVVRNTGADTLKPGDSATFVWTMDGSEVFTTLISTFKPSANFLPGDSVSYIRSTFFWDTIFQPFRFCLKVECWKNGMKTTDANLANNTSCKTFMMDLNSNVGDEVKPTSLLSVYPNPATNDLNITTAGAAEGTVVLSDITGREVVQVRITNGKAHINTSGFQAGVYFCTVYNEAYFPIATQKVSINR